MVNEEQAGEREGIIFSFLPDSPAPTDEFGTHQRVADSIASAVKTNAEGMTIGLAGEWGSGKSSVISMLDKLWQKEDLVTVFTFDAWAHERDSLRRSFLEELITHLQSATWLEKMPGSGEGRLASDPESDDEDKCRPDIMRQELRHRREHTVITTKPQITGLGISFALCTLLMPIGVALLAAGTITGPRFWIGLLLAAVSPVLMCLGLGYHYWARKEGTASFLGEFIGKSRDTTRTSTHRGVDPTSIEFREYYEEILELAFEGCPERKLVVVLDNLDRIAPDMAKLAWATMRTFVRPGCGAENDLRKRVWLIVPFEPEKIKELWEANSKSDLHLARTFKEKAFQILYRVAPPLTSRWQKYFKDLLREALKNAPEKTFHDIYQIFRVKAVPVYERGTPTPREMKVFINRVTAVAQQHADVALQEVALYASLELGDIKTAVNDLANGELEMPGAVTDVLSDDWPSGLAAIHFGVERDDANEVLLRPRIQEILATGNAADLAKLLNETGGPESFNTHVQDSAKDLDFTGVLQASRALRDQKPGAALIHVSRAAQRLAGRLSTMHDGPWGLEDTLTPDDAHAVVGLLEFNPGIRHSISHFLSLTVPDENADMESLLSEWVPAATVIVNHLSEGPAFRGISISLPDADSYLTLLGILSKDPVNRKLIKYFGPADEKKDEYREHVLNRIRNGAITDDDAYILDGLIDMPGWDRQEITSQVAMAVKSGVSQGVPDAILSGCGFLLERRSDAEHGYLFAAALQEYGVSLQLRSALAQHHATPELAALCAALLTLYNPRLDLPEGQESEEGRPQFDLVFDQPADLVVKAMAALCIKYNLASEFLVTVSREEWQDETLVSELLRELVSRDSNAQVLTSDVFMGHHALLKTALDVEAEEQDEEGTSPYVTLTERLLAADLLAKLETAPADIQLMPAYYRAIRHDGKSPCLAGKLQDFLHTLDESQWSNALQEDMWTLDVLLQLRDDGWSPNLGRKFANALVAHAKNMIDGSAGPPALVSGDLSDLIDCIAHYERKPFRRKLVDDILTNGSSSILPLLRSYGGELHEAVGQELVAPAGARRTAVKDAMAHLANPELPEQERWIVHVLASYVDAIDLSKEETQRFHDRLHDPLRKMLVTTNQSDPDTPTEKSVDEEHRPQIERLAEMLGVDVSEGTYEPDQQSGAAEEAEKPTGEVDPAETAEG
ncbi:hypothetical protein LCGC14_0315720 [marine sediment metagenome]|uniref:KAP NTPase domain-containing protein n=1 Tax=marine sediment metagenome TaxID=412755 RepID=A0A0F9W837_9ZZZZ